MSKSLLIVSLCLVLLSPAMPVLADQYDDCINGCKENVPPCVEQARLSAGNVQEEEDMIAACGKGKDVCIQACRDAETQTQPPPQEPS